MFVKSRAKEYFSDAPEGDAILTNATFLQMYVDLIFEDEDLDGNGFISYLEFEDSYNKAESRKKAADSHDEL